MNRRAVLYRGAAAIATGLVASLIDVFPESTPPVRPVPNAIAFRMDRAYVCDFDDPRCVEQLVRELSRITEGQGNMLLVGLPIVPDWQRGWSMRDHARGFKLA